MKPAKAARPGEEGYMLLAAIILLALLMISLSVAIPQIAKEIQRDREIETMHRGKQYIRGIKMYYKKFNAYPPNLDALMKPNGPGNLRFMRKKYVDPTTGKADWKLIHFGEAKTQTLGFFGQPLAGTGTAGGSLMAGVGPGASTGLGGQTLGGGLTSSSGLGASTIGTSASSTPTDAGAAGQTTSQSGNQAGSSSTTSGDSGSSGSTSSAFGSSSGSGQTFGGLGIIGVSPMSPKPSILVYKKKTHYNEWEFVYDPLEDMMTSGGAGLPSATPISGASGLGTPTTPTTPTAPTGP